MPQSSHDILAHILTHAPWRLFFTCETIQPLPTLYIFPSWTRHPRAILYNSPIGRSDALHCTTTVVAYGLLISIGSHSPVTHERFLEESTVLNHHIPTLAISEDFRRQELLTRHLVPSHGPVCDQKSHQAQHTLTSSHSRFR